jgi:hypothetical protein
VTTTANNNNKSAVARPTDTIDSGENITLPYYYLLIIINTTRHCCCLCNKHPQIMTHKNKFPTHSSSASYLAKNEKREKRKKRVFVMCGNIYCKINCLGWYISSHKQKLLFTSHLNCTTTVRTLFYIKRGDGMPKEWKVMYK